MAEPTNTNQQVNELVELIHRFFAHLIESDNTELSEAGKESLSVANECLEQAYKIEKKPASSHLLDIYRNSRQQQTNQQQQQQPQQQPNAQPFGPRGPLGPDAQFIITNMLSSFFNRPPQPPPAPSQAQQQSTATGGVDENNSNTNTTNTTSASSPEQASSTTPKVRKSATEAEKLAAESFKTQGNDLMKQDKYKEAYDSYTQAIEIDDNNAIYYSNRAAASSKLGNHQAALEDCREAIEIDPTYPKAYGRMGVAYATMNDHKRAKEAYQKAVELDPRNEGYRNNLKIAEEKLRTPVVDYNEPNTMWVWRSFVPDSQLIEEMRRNPSLRIYDLAEGPPGPNRQPINLQIPEQTATNTQQNATTQGANQTQNNSQPNQNQQPSATDAPNQAAPGINPVDLISMASRIAGSANIDLVGAGQQLLSTLQQNNPDVLNNMLQMMNQAFARPPNPNQNQDNSRDPPPGYS